MKEAMLKVMACTVLAIGFFDVSGASAQVMTPITYTGSVTGTGGGNTLTANYTITTDGTIGSLIKANILSFTNDFVFNGTPDVVDSFTSNTPGSGFSLDNGLLSATSNDITFDYSSSNNLRFVIFGTGDNGVIFSTALYGRGPISPPRYTVQEDSDVVSYSVNQQPTIKVIASVIPVFTPIAAVPEPGTWSMMILGIGAVGFAMRRRQRVTARIALA